MKWVSAPNLCLTREEMVSFLSYYNLDSCIELKADLNYF